MRKYKRILPLLITILIFVSGCIDNPVYVDAALNSEFDIKYGQTVLLKNENMLITFEDVNESRCPVGVKCIWEGTAKIKLKIRQNGYNKIDTVETFCTDNLVKIGVKNNSYIFRVKKLIPYPKYNEEINKHDYVLTLEVRQFTYGFPSSVTSSGKTGVYGQIFISPVYPSSKYCDINEAPYRANVKIINITTGNADVIESDSTGRFIFYTQPGYYKIFAINTNPEQITPRSDTVSCTVIKNNMNFVTIIMDSGIR